MRNFIISYLATATVLISLEAGWLSQTAERLYRRALGAIMADKVRVSAVAAFYVVYVFGIVIFAVQPALEGGGWRSALTQGTLFGFFAYATYDLTNLATLKVWSLKITIIDMAWGALVTGISASVSVLVTGLVGK